MMVQHDADCAVPQPCAECPWRRDVAPGRFPPSRFEALATTAEDRATTQFACHKTHEDRPLACAGFLMRGAVHNIAVRLGRMDGRYQGVTDGGHPLYDNYREMAEANGVAHDHPALARVRTD